MKVQLKEAPNYSITNTGTILNEKTTKAVTVKNGSVRLVVDGKRKTFNVSALVVNNPIETVADVVEKVGRKEAPKAIAEKLKEVNDSRKPKKKEKKAAKKKEKINAAKAIKEGLYPYAMKGSKEIEAAKKSFSAGDKVTFTDYKTKRKVTGTFVSHTKFSDNYPAARVSVGKGKDKKSSLKSYLTIKKK